jgi:hypothetical protein
MTEQEIRRLSAEELIHPPLQAQLQARGHGRDEDEWWIGDVGAELEDELVPDKPSEWRHRDVAPPMKADIWRAISQFYGQAPDTIRGYIRVSRGVSKALRDEFDMLFRSVHIAVLDHSKGDQDKHRELCLKVLEMGDSFGGTIPSVAVVRTRLDVEAGGDPLWVKWTGGLVKAAKKLSGNDDTPVDVRRVSDRFMADIKRTSYKQYLEKEKDGTSEGSTPVPPFP